MQPKTEVTFDKESFNRLKRRVKSMSLTRRGRKKDPGYALPSPEEVGVQLTYRCNLRCKHCYQLNDNGHFNNMEESKKNAELPLELFDKILYETSESKSDLFLWGGEPLLYSQWDGMAELLARDPRWSVICTNGLLIEKRMESMLPISEHIALLVSIEGFKDQHDAIRGPGTFEKLTKQIKTVLDLQKKGEFKGKLSLTCVMSDGLAGHVYDFMEYAEELGVDTMYFCYPWFISQEAGQEMNDYYHSNFPWLEKIKLYEKMSWDSYTYAINPESVALLKKDIVKLNSRQWKIRIRFQPPLAEDEIEPFILGKKMKVKSRQKCMAVSDRMDVLADGNVCACKLFPEFIVGNLHKDSLMDIWQSDAFRSLRCSIDKGLMPICTKCSLLYLNGV